MITGFTARKPWVSAVVGLIFSPSVGMLYLSKGRWALCYLVVSCLLISLPFVLAHFSFIETDPRQIMNYLLLGLQVLGAVHCYMIAKLHYTGTVKWFGRWYNIILITYILPIAVATALRLFLYESFIIPNVSMEPTLTPADYFFVDKRAYKTGHLPQRGDVIVFNTHSNGRKAQYIKRIIGIPNDYVQIKNGQISVNGNPIGNQALSINNDTDQTHLIEANQYYVIGDNGDHSHDSRNGLGDISLQDITGKGVAIVWNFNTYKFSYRHIE